MIYDYIVVGAGQAGLAIAYYLKREGFNFVVIDGDDTLGGSWLRRWDSLTLFTPTQYNGLPGLDFPMEKGRYPGKDAVAQYLNDYVNQYDIPVKLNCSAENVRRVDGLYHVSSRAGFIQTHNVIVATGPFHTPAIPKFAKQLSKDVVQLHSRDYKNPQQLQPGNTLVVGGGDSGVQILEELAENLDTVHFSGECSAMVLPQEFLGKTLWWWLLKLGILKASKYSWLGKILSKRAQPIIGTNVRKLFARDNVVQLGRSVSAQADSIRCEKGVLNEVRNVVWATGYRPDFSWIEDIKLDEKGYPLNYRGVSEQQGLYFIGLPWLYTRGSATLGGVKDDAEFLASQLVNPSSQTLSMQTNMGH